MRTTNGRPGIGRVLCTAAVALLLAAVAMAPTGATSEGAAAKTPGGATFDLYSMFPAQMLSPSTGLTETFMPIEVRNITGGGAVELSAECEDRAHFRARVDDRVLAPAGSDGIEKTRVYVSTVGDVPDNTVGWVKVIGRRGGEKHHLWLSATALASDPELLASRGLPFTGQGYMDQEVKAYAGKPLTWHLQAKNAGGAEDTYGLSYKADFPCRVVFRDAAGRETTSVDVKGRTRNLMFAKPVELTAVVTPRGGLEPGKEKKVTFRLGQGANTDDVSELSVGVLDPGLLYCAGDLDGAKPHPHQVMAGETTSFIFHVTDTGKKEVDVSLGVDGAQEGWKVSLDRYEFESLAPGKSEQATLKVKAPAGAAKGERLELTVKATASDGKMATSRVAAEVTDVPNVYYWSVDSMDPEYLDLDREGTGKGKKGDWLMPNMRAFMEENTSYSDARVYLPSATDMNHTNALAGTYTGTMGVYMVGGTYRGFTEHDEVLTGPNSVSLMKYGPDGAPVKRMYEVAKEQTGGKTWTGFWSNKNWLAEMEGERAVDIVGHSEKWPLFFYPPYKYRAAGDPKADKDPGDELSCSARALFHSNNSSAVLVPTVLGQFDLFYGVRLLTMPIALLFGKTPGMHAEDRYIYDMFERSVLEEDPDVSYVNIGDLDNTGHFTGASYPLDEWKSAAESGQNQDDNIYSPWLRRGECIDIAREADILFGQFVDMLKERGVYDNSIIVLLSDHGMENMKDPKKGYQVIDLREILRKKGYVFKEDYQESGGTELNMIWCDDRARCAEMAKVLESYTVNDKELGVIKPLLVVDREEMKTGVDCGKKGHVRPNELYSEYWIDHPGGPDGEVWPDLFVFPYDNYQVVAHGDALATGINNVGFSFGINVPESVKFGLPGAHGGLDTVSIPLVLKVPSSYGGYRRGATYAGEVGVGDIAPTLYRVLGWPSPASVDGKPLPTP